MNNIEAFNILEACNNNTREASEQIAREFEISEEELPSIRSKLIHFKNIRRDFVKRGDLTTWERMHFTDNPHPKSMVLKKRKSSDTLSELCNELCSKLTKILNSEHHFLSYSLNKSDAASILYCHTLSR